MPSGSRVDRCFQKVRKSKGDSSAAAICQSSTGQSLATGKSKRKADGKPIGSPHSKKKSRSESFEQRLGRVLAGDLQPSGAARQRSFGSRLTLALETIGQISGDAATVARQVASYFQRNFAQRSREGLGYNIYANGQGRLTIAQDGSLVPFKVYEVQAAVEAGEDAETIIGEIESAMEMLRRNPETPPSSAELGREMDDYYAAPGRQWTGD